VRPGASSPDCTGDSGSTTSGSTSSGSTTSGSSGGTTGGGTTPSRTLVGEASLSEAARWVLMGESSGDWAGISVAPVHDAFGAGTAAVLVGGRNADDEAGAAWMVFDPPDGVSALADADVRIRGSDGELLGWSVGSPGDLDGDGYPEIMVGAPNAGSGGAAYLWYGPVSGDLPPSGADATVAGEEIGEQVGTRVCTAGDVDADGRPELIVGAWLADDGGTNAGAAALLLDPPTGVVSLRQADVMWLGETADDWAGYTACGGGDVDGDGGPDVVVGADGVDTGGTNAGAGYLITSFQPGTWSLSESAARYVGEAEYDNAAHTIEIVGDTDGDGRADVLVGALGSAAARPRAGAAYLLTSAPTGEVPLSESDVVLLGQEHSAHFGYTVAGAGDVDGDGLSDVLIGARFDPTGGESAGGAWLLYGPVTSTDTAESGAHWWGDAGAEASYGLASAGDIDGDGRPEVAVGAYLQQGVGAVYILGSGGAGSGGGSR